MTAPRFDVVIVGAGISGLTAGRALQAAGLRVAVLEKGGGPGGRMATRRLTGLNGATIPCDHGAQFFTARTEVFRRQVDAWRRAGLVGEWATRFAHADGNYDRQEEPRFFGLRGMNSLAKSMAEGLDVRSRQTVERLTPQEGMYRIEATEGQSLMARAVVLTAPLPQSFALLDASGLAGERINDLRAITYDPCFAVGAVLDAPTRIPAPGGLRFQGGPIGWIADGHLKGLHSEGHSVVIHASPEFSRTHFRGDREASADILLELAREWVGTGKIIDRHVHGWLYSIPLPHPDPHAVCFRTAHDEPPLLLAGDGLAGGRIEGAFHSGNEAAHCLVTRLSP